MTSGFGVRWSKAGSVIVWRTLTLVTLRARNSSARVVGLGIVERPRPELELKRCVVGLSFVGTGGARSERRLGALSRRLSRTCIDRGLDCLYEAPSVGVDGKEKSISDTGCDESGPAKEHVRVEDVGVLGGVSRLVLGGGGIGMPTRRAYSALGM